MLSDYLRENSSSIVKRWFELTLDSYSPDSRPYFQDVGARFTNPVGSTLHSELEAIFNDLVDGFDAEALYPSLNNIVSIRAVQEFSPSQAMGFIFCLKQAVRERLCSESSEVCSINDILDFETKVDQLVLLSFEIYMSSKQKIYDIKATEIRQRTARLLDRYCGGADQIKAPSEEDTDSSGTD
ncbi:MAG: RsbRD N-terminal domain-containing protein [bacterium]